MRPNLANPITHFTRPPTFSLVLVLSSFLLLPQVCPAFDYAVGADLSFLKQAEDRGTVFKDEGQPKPGLQIIRDHGYNWIRLRLFHTPTRLPNDLPYTIALAKEANRLGYKFLLDFHYSDTWADPGKQYPPKSWEGNHTRNWSRQCSSTPATR